MNKEEQKKLIIEMMELDEKDGLYVHDDILAACSIANASYLQPNSFTFNLNGQQIIVINENGFTYNGKLIEDAGEVYRLFKEFLLQAQNK